MTGKQKVNTMQGNDINNIVKMARKLHIYYCGRIAA
jgi:hypothetical protein